MQGKKKEFFDFLDEFNVSLSFLDIPLCIGYRKKTNRTIISFVRRGANALTCVEFAFRNASNQWSVFKKGPYSEAFDYKKHPSKSLFKLSVRKKENIETTLFAIDDGCFY
jgi:hypothetical protein